jgi:hypothetical protein
MTCTRPTTASARSVVGAVVDPVAAAAVVAVVAVVARSVRTANRAW